MRAEREKRAAIAESEGERQSRINRADGEKQEAIAKSEGEKARRVNEAEGRAAEIRLVAEATATGIRAISQAVNEPGGSEAMKLRLAEQYIAEFGKIAIIVALAAHVFGGGGVLFYGAGWLQRQTLFHCINFFYNNAHFLAYFVNLAKICVGTYIFKVAYVNKAVNSWSDVYKNSELGNAADFSCLF